MRLDGNKFHIRRKVFTVGGAKYHIFNEAGEMVLYCKQKAFKLKEDIRLYEDETLTTELLVIQARSVVDFSATYDVFDPETNAVIGSLQRKGMKSMIQDEWHVLDGAGNQFGIIKEDSMGLALVRRFLSALVPQNFDFLVNGVRVVDLKQAFNPFIYKLEVNFTDDKEGVVDKKLGIAAGILISTIEGRQN